MVIYKITNLQNGKSYIGKTKNNVKKRWGFHCRNKYNKSYIQNAITKYGKDNFKFEVIAEAIDEESMSDLEEFYIVQYNTLHPHGYNMVVGEKEKQKVSTYTRKKQSELKKGHTPWNKGKKWDRIGGYKKCYCVNNDTIYESIKAASKDLDVCQSKISVICKSNTNRQHVNGYFFCYIKDNTNIELQKQKAKEKMLNYQRGTTAKTYVDENGNTYKGIKEIQNICTLKYATIYWRIQNNVKINGLIFSELESKA